MIGQISDNSIQLNKTINSLLFIVTLSQLVHTLVTLVSHSHNLFQLVLLDRCH